MKYSVKYIVQRPVFRTRLIRKKCVPFGRAWFHCASDYRQTRIPALRCCLCRAVSWRGWRLPGYTVPRSRARWAFCPTRRFAHDLRGGSRPGTEQRTWGPATPPLSGGLRVVRWVLERGRGKGAEEYHDTFQGVEFWAWNTLNRFLFNWERGRKVFLERSDSFRFHGRLRRLHRE